MICFAWDGFPQYAARCVGAFVKMHKEESAVVVATRPSVPIHSMENVCGCPVYWIEPNDQRMPQEIIGEIPTVLIVSGWSIPSFNNFRDVVRSHGGRIVAMCDNNYAFSFKECLRAIRFRLFLRHRYNKFFVPGESGRRLMRFYGVRESDISTGMYAADPELFFQGRRLTERPKRFLYVGQLNDRKNVIRIAEAFEQIHQEFHDWEFDIYGSGPLRDLLVGRPGINVHNFVQPEELAPIYREARCFILGSLSEHWGLVVHEAALSGCYLLLSNRVGAANDFCARHRAHLFDPLRVDDIAHRMRDFILAFQIESERNQLFADVSSGIQASQLFTPVLFAKTVAEKFVGNKISQRSGICVE